MLKVPLKPGGTRDYDEHDRLLDAICDKVQTTAKNYDEAVAMYRAEGVSDKSSMILAGYDFPDE